MTAGAGLTKISAGFIPLIDSAILIVAERKGFAAREGLRLDLARETSWANIRDKIAVGRLEIAHMLAPMPIAANLRLDPLPAEMIAPMALGLNGNTITVSNALWARLQTEAAIKPGDAAGFARAFAAILAKGAAGATPNARPAFGIVHANSSHHYELAYLLASAGLRPGVDVEFVVLPPALMVDALASGQISGFCAGEPWGSLACARGQGRIVTTKAAIWRSSPEKVLGMRADWAQARPETLAGLLRALYAAACWCDAPEHRPELAALLAQPEHLDQSADLLAQALAGETSEPAGLNAFVFAARAATFPWTSHALWFYSQMVRWGQAPFTLEALQHVRRTYRPDLYRAALGPLGVTLPSANAKVEGALTTPTGAGSSTGQLVLGPDGFFDGRIFDPDRIEDYIKAFGAPEAAQGRVE